MTISGLFFLIIGFLLSVFIGHRKLIGSRVLPLLLFIYHIAFAFFYWHYSLDNPADALRYYNTAIGYPVTFGIGTRFIEWLTQLLQAPFSASYLDMFLLFHIAGFLGICFLYRTVIETIPVQQSSRAKKAKIILFLLPGMHFWTSAIGKDSVIFLGITLCYWGLASFKQRLVYFACGFLIVLLVRPHIAIFILVAVGFSIFWGKDIPLRWRTALTIVVVTVCFVILPFVLNYIGLASTNPESLDEYFEKRQSYYSEGGSNVDISGYPFPLKFLTFLYRPFFFDTTSTLGLAVSVENLILLLFSIVLFSNLFLRLYQQHPNKFFLRFNIFYFLLTTSLLSLTTTNLGLAIRQKIMILPSLIILTLTTYAVKRYILLERRFRQQLAVKDNWQRYFGKK